MPSILQPGLLLARCQVHDLLTERWEALPIGLAFPELKRRPPVRTASASRNHRPRVPHQPREHRARDLNLHAVQLLQSPAQGPHDALDLFHRAFGQAVRLAVAHRRLLQHYLLARDALHNPGRFGLQCQDSRLLVRLQHKALPRQRS